MTFFCCDTVTSQSSNSATPKLEAALSIQDIVGTAQGMVDNVTATPTEVLDSMMDGQASGAFEALSDAGLTGKEGWSELLTNGPNVDDKHIAAYGAVKSAVLNGEVFNAQTKMGAQMGAQMGMKMGMKMKDLLKDMKNGKDLDASQMATLGAMKEAVRVCGEQSLVQKLGPAGAQMAMAAAAAKVAKAKQTMSGLGGVWDTVSSLCSSDGDGNADDGMLSKAERSFAKIEMFLRKKGQMKLSREDQDNLEGDENDLVIGMMEFSDEVIAMAMKAMAAAMEVMAGMKALKEVSAAAMDGEMDKAQMIAAMAMGVPAGGAGGAPGGGAMSPGMAAIMADEDLMERIRSTPGCMEAIMHCQKDPAAARNYQGNPAVFAVLMEVAAKMQPPAAAPAAAPVAPAAAPAAPSAMMLAIQQDPQLMMAIKEHPRIMVALQRCQKNPAAAMDYKGDPVVFAVLMKVARMQGSM